MKKSSAMEESNALKSFGMRLGNDTAEDAVVEDSFLRRICQKHKLIADAARNAADHFGSACPRTSGIVPATETESSRHNLSSTHDEENAYNVEHNNKFALFYRTSATTLVVRRVWISRHK